MLYNIYKLNPALHPCYAGRRGGARMERREGRQAGLFCSTGCRVLHCCGLLRSYGAKQAVGVKHLRWRKKREEKDPASWASKKLNTIIIVPSRACVEGGRWWVEKVECGSCQRERTVSVPGSASRAPPPGFFQFGRAGAGRG